jgi:hypothetical protein
VDHGQDIQNTPLRALDAENDANREDRWFFLFGLEKNERANISGRELEALQSLAHDLLELDSRQLDAQVASLALDEICNENQV